MENVAFNEFYSLMNIAGIIIVEDSIEFDFSRKAVMYDYLMLTDDERENLMAKILGEQVKCKLKKINDAYSKCKNKFIWGSVPKRDVEYYVKRQELDELKKAIEDMAVGQTMPNLNVPIVSRFQIIKPPVEVQNSY